MISTIILTTTALFALVNAQNAPACFGTCFTEAESSTSCDINSDTCLCADNNWLNTIGQCILDSGTCTGSDINAAVSVIENACQAVGEPIQVTTTDVPANPTPTTKGGGGGTTPAPGPTPSAPACFATCFDQAEQATTCSASDDSCLCNDNSFITTIGECILDSGTCSGSDITAATQVVEQACAAVGVTISVSTAAGGGAPTTGGTGGKPTFTPANPSTTPAPTMPTTPTTTPAPAPTTSKGNSPFSSGGALATSAGAGIGMTVVSFMVAVAFVL